MIRNWTARAACVLGAVLLVAVLVPAQLQAQAKSGGRIKVLFLGDNGHHRPYERAKESLMVTAANGIDLFYTDETKDLNPDELDKYHVLMLYNNHGNVTQPQLAAMLEFVGDGGGLVVLHCASASFQNSEEFIKLVGASFKSHGTGSFAATRVVPNHPALDGVPNFTSPWEETYIHTKHNPVNRTVLEVRKDGTHEEPWTWVKPYGKGRVYYTAWGHDQRTWGVEGFQKQLMQATKWAAGDWALTQRIAEPNPQEVPLEVPIPTYRRDTLVYDPATGRPRINQLTGKPSVEWNIPGPGKTTAPVALSTDESLKLATLRPGFKAVPFATEPLIGNIIDFAWDPRGRMWAIETNDYPNDVLPDSIVLRSAGPYPGGKDRIIIIEDANNDGTADNVKVFAEGMNLATSLVLANGGVVVGQAPHMLFFKDNNGDDKADERRILFTGWPRNDTHGTISNLRYAFDNQILGSVGYNGFFGKVGNDEYVRGQGSGGFTMGAGYFRFPATGTALDYIARTSNNTWGVALTEDNLVFGSTANSRPTNYVHIPGRYYRSIGVNPQALPHIADRIDVYAIRETWQVDQFDMYTAAAAHEMYTARLFPREYWNRVGFVVEPTAHVVGMFEMIPNGSGFAAKNRWNLMASRDAWAAPVQVKVGPDGALWVSDFYTLIAQHNPEPRCRPNGLGCARTPPPGTHPDSLGPYRYRSGPGAAYNTPNRDRLHGRIYKIVPENATLPRPMRLDNATPAQLVAALRNDNMFWRMTAQQRLVEGKHTAAVPALVQLASDHTVDGLGLNVGALHALWTLHGLGAIPGDAAALTAARNALHHPAASVRRAALQVLPRTEQTLNDVFAAGMLPDRASPHTVEYTVASQILQDADPVARLDAVLLLSELPASPRSATALLEVLFSPQNARDRWIPEAVAIAGAKQGPSFAGEVLKRRIPGNADSVFIGGIRTTVAMLTQYYTRNRNVEAVVGMLSAITPQTNPTIANAVLNAIAPAGGGGGGGRAGGPGQGAGGGGGWAQDEPPTLTQAQKDALIAAAKAAPAEVQEGFHRVAARWGMPDLFR